MDSGYTYHCGVCDRAVRKDRKTTGVDMKQDQGGQAQQVLDERGSSYGSVIEQARISEQIKTIMRTGNFNELPPFMQQSLDMFALKMSRILAGDPTKLDSWLDIEGYARLARQTEAKLQGIPDGEGSE